MEVDSHKRTRELSISPQIMNESKKNRDKEQKEQTIERQEDPDKYQPEGIQRRPPQPPPRQPREDEEAQTTKKKRESENNQTSRKKRCITNKTFKKAWDEGCRDYSIS